MRNAFLLLTVLSAGVYVSAQQSSVGKPPQSEACPIGFGAQVNARDIARKAEDVKKNGDGPLLELTFGQRGTPKVMGAVVKVHGVMSSNSYLLMDERSGADMTQTFDLGGAAGLTDTSVSVTKLSYVDWAEVTELRYADGSSWHASSKGGCRAVPSKFRLIDATASSAIR